MSAPPIADTDFRRIAEPICQTHGISLAAILGPDRRRDVVEARRHVMATFHEKGFVLRVIADRFVRDITTVAEAINNHKGQPRPQRRRETQQ